MKVIAIDGPAGSGKSTVARSLAQRIGLAYLDTGAMYRGVTFAVLQRGIDPSDASAVAALTPQLDLELDDSGIRVDGHDATAAIRGPAVTRAVSAVAANPEVRRVLVKRQRVWVERHGGGVVEGRDIGTVVFPDASLKVFLTAKPEVRAQRRSKEVGDLDHTTVAADLARRDALDSARTTSPLAVADDALVVDTSDLTVDQIIAQLLERTG